MTPRDKFREEFGQLEARGASGVDVTAALDRLIASVGTQMKALVASDWAAEVRGLRDGLRMHLAALEAPDTRLPDKYDDPALARRRIFNKTAIVQLTMLLDEPA